MAVRVREHVNPLSERFQRPVPLPVWSQVYAQLDRPFHLDIGCGKGNFLLAMAQCQPNWNFLGLEIREPLVAQANDRAAQLKLDNLYYLFCNANITLDALLASLPSQTLQAVSIQFPDPWFKRRHQKRRVVQPELVAALAKFLRPGGQVFLQSDVWEVAEEMQSHFAVHPDFQPIASSSWLAENPFPVASDRERATLDRGKPIYRAGFQRQTMHNSPQSPRLHHQPAPQPLTPDQQK